MRARGHLTRTLACCNARAARRRPIPAHADTIVNARAKAPRSGQASLTQFATIFARAFARFRLLFALPHPVRGDRIHHR
jgi:hypothetical protein